MFPLGKNFEKMWDDYDHKNYVIQLLLAANPATGSILLFDDDYSVGSSIELMSRNDQKTVDSARADTCELCDQLDSKNNLCALYINFAGRSGTKLGAEGTQRRGRRYHACRVHPRFRAEVVGVTGTVYPKYSWSSATRERRGSSERARLF